MKLSCPPDLIHFLVTLLFTDGPEKGASRRKRKSIDSSASELDNQEYLSSSYGSGAPMKPGECTCVVLFCFLSHSLLSVLVFSFLINYILISIEFLIAS